MRKNQRKQLRGLYEYTAHEKTEERQIQLEVLFTKFQTKKIGMKSDDELNQTMVLGFRNTVHIHRRQILSKLNDHNTRNIAEPQQPCNSTPDKVKLTMKICNDQNIPTYKSADSL